MKGIPFTVSHFLESAIARIRRIYLIRGSSAAGIVWILGLSAVMLIDSRFVILDDYIRWAMTMGVWLLTLLVALIAIAVPLCRRLDFQRIAAILDRRHPEQEERLSTLVELAQRDVAKAGFSTSLFALVCNLAENDISRLSLQREFSFFGAWRQLSIFVVLILSLGISAMVSPNLVGRLLVRAVAPWSDVGNLFSNEIVVKPGDLTVLSGSIIRIEASSSLAQKSLQPRSSFSIRISRQSEQGWSEETVELMPNGIYETTADINERVWRYRITAGHAVTRYYYVRISQMPRYDLFTATVDYPAYTHMRSLVISNADVALITAVAGSHVKFEVQASDADTLVDFRINHESRFDYTMVSNKTANWSLDLVNGDGFRAEKERNQLKSCIDQPPTVLIEKPTGTLRLPPHAKIPIEITGTDDIAIDELYLRISIDGTDWERYIDTKIELPADRHFVRTMAEVDLSLYDLIFAKNVRFDVIACDACPPEFGGPHAATSMPFTVQFAVDEASYETQELRAQVADVRRDIDESRKRLNDAQNLARQVRDELRRNSRVATSTEEKAERLAHELEEAERRMSELRDLFLADERFAPLSRPLERLLSEILKPVLEEVENAQFRDQDERADAIDETIPNMEKAVQELDEFSKRLAERVDKVDIFEKVKDLTARQEALAKAAEDLTREHPLDTAKLEAWKSLEEAAMRKAEELARQNPEPDISEAKRKMETAAREMAQLKEQITSAVAQSNQLAKAEQELRAAVANLTNQVNRQVLENINQKLQKGLLQQQAETLKKAVDAQKAAQEALDAVLTNRVAEAEARRKSNQPMDAQHQAALTEQAKAAQEAAKVAAAAQKQAEDQLQRGEATEGTKAMQQVADKAASASQKAPHDVDRAKRAAAAQQAAAKALKEEQALREALAKGEKKPEDLESFDRAMRAAAAQQSAALNHAEQKAAEQDRKASQQNNQAAADLAQAVANQKRALGAIQQAAAKRAEEARAREQNNPSVAEARAREAQTLERQAAEEQRFAEDRLERSGAMKGVKALQEMATTSLRNARKAPQTKEKFDQALAAQKAATEALQNELKIREGLRKGEMTEDDLAALDDQLKENLLQQASERTIAAKEAAAEAIQKAKDVIGTEDDVKLGKLSHAALEAARDAISAQLSESKLKNDNAQAAALRDLENALDARMADAMDEQLLEDRIRGLQKSAAEALARSDRGRAQNLQKDISRAQSRASDLVNEEEERVARADANAAQAEAMEAIEQAAQTWNQETKARAEAAQQAAIESEQTAQAEAQSVRALSKLGLAEKMLTHEAEAQALQQQSSSPSDAAETAEEAADAMNREVNAQAVALGMSQRGAQAATQHGKSQNGGGGVNEEVKKLANDLKSKENPSLLKSLFSRFGWFKIRGLSRDGLGLPDLKDVPPEYRDLVRRYFLKLSESVDLESAH